MPSNTRKQDELAERMTRIIELATVIRQEQPGMYAILEAAIEWKEAMDDATRKDGLHLSGPKFNRWDDAEKKLNDLLPNGSVPYAYERLRDRVKGLTDEQDAQP